LIAKYETNPIMKQPNKFTKNVPIIEYGNEWKSEDIMYLSNAPIAPPVKINIMSINSLYHNL
jgi:hypothetical protein